MTKKHSKLGNRAGKPAYRTPSSFIIRKKIDVQTQRAQLQRAKTYQKKHV